MIASTANDTIGGTTADARNLISGNNWQGISLSGATGTVIQGNLIGTDVSGTVDLGNSLPGVGVSSSPGTTIGGATPGARNIISGNDSVGVVILSGSAGSVVIGNFIGTDVSGTASLGSSGGGVIVPSSAGLGIRIGGTAAGEGNLISGNNFYGVQIRNVASLVQGNFIGTDVTGASSISDQIGVEIVTVSCCEPIPPATNNTIGGTTPDARNVISGNSAQGVLISGSGTSGNLVQGNFIGTDVTGTVALGNGGSGVAVEFGPQLNTIGGTTAGAGNTVAFNGSDGVFVGYVTSTGNAILGNSIYSNSGLGIDLVPGGVTPNDAGDVDTGPNNLQNFPVLSSATRVAGGTTRVDGTLNSTTTATFRLEFFANSACDASGNGEGESFLGYLTSTTDGTGSGSFSAAFAAAVSPGHFVTATATDSQNNTSEFSACVPVILAEGVPGISIPGLALMASLLAAASAWAMWRRRIRTRFQRPGYNHY